MVAKATVTRNARSDEAGARQLSRWRSVIPSVHQGRAAREVFEKAEKRRSNQPAVAKTITLAGAKHFDADL